MLIIRFSRVGKKNHSQFRVVLAEKSSPVKGKAIEVLGGYDPHSKVASLKEDRIKYWISKGASLSDSVHNLMVTKGVIEGAKRKVNVKSKEVENTEGASSVAHQEDDKKDGENKTKETVVEDKEVEINKIAGAVTESKESKVEKPVEEVSPLPERDVANQGGKEASKEVGIEEAKVQESKDDQEVVGAKDLEDKSKIEEKK